MGGITEGILSRTNYRIISGNTITIIYGYIPQRGVILGFTLHWCWHMLTLWSPPCSDCGFADFTEDVGHLSFRFFSLPLLPVMRKSKFFVVRCKICQTPPAMKGLRTKLDPGPDIPRSPDRALESARIPRCCNPQTMWSTIRNVANRWIRGCERLQNTPVGWWLLRSLCCYELLCYSWWWIIILHEPRIRFLTNQYYEISVAFEHCSVCEHPKDTVVCNQMGCYQ